MNVKSWKNPLSWVNPPAPHVMSVNTSIQKRENGSADMNMALVPGIGQYYFKYGDAWIQVESFYSHQSGEVYLIVHHLIYSIQTG